MLLCVLLTLPDPTTWSPKLSQLVKAGEIEIIHYDLNLDYDYWDYRMYVPDFS